MAINKITDPLKPHTVSEITALIRVALETGFGSVWIEGEISNAKIAPSGHLYFTLKDANCQITAVMWKARVSRVAFDLKDGIEAIGRGRISVYGPRGQYQFIVEELTQKGLGAQDLALKRLKEKLLKLGYFARERKRPLPRFPASIALVTSPSGAAVRDMLEILGRRWPIAEVTVCPVRVQGDTAATEITRTLRTLNQIGRHDVIILGRGGGPSEDLSPFNEEIMARAIFESQIPIVAAVGHEIDVSIADMTADRRAATPSEAAELVAPNRMELLADVNQSAKRMKSLLFRRLQEASQRLDYIANRPVLRRPLDRIREVKTRLEQWATRLHRAMQTNVRRAQQELAKWAAQLQSLSPLNVLGRGYSLTRKEKDGKVVRSVRHVRNGDKILTFVQDGQITSRVQQSVDTQQDLFSQNGGDDA